ncbi:YciI family protein [Chitinophaga niabensis]|uniref:YCII-related domain-containing protein n=1 Tax=Chitinophaga niabensis TaxID=536979 RepID=A0A1N6GAI2_9BACT|nr:YciI family protein [Chitinophaga niabensis]SIO04461.1 YCII-related domain-containing protein [Chitinophaga niabensis]
MAKLLPVLLLAVFLTFVIARFTSKPLKTAAAEEPIQKTESKKYWMVMLRSDINRQQDPGTTSQLRDAHISAVRNLVKEGKLIVASPFTENEELQDVIIVECKDSLEVVDLIQQDSAVAAGWLKAEIRPCWPARSMYFK